MPVALISGVAVLFAHVPKCAGSSVEDYLKDAFGPLALLDRRFLSPPEEQRWSKTSPQHADAATLQRLFPPGFLAASFAMVRHPVARIVSVFRWQREIEATIEPDIPFTDWLATTLIEQPRGRWGYDNHVRPMTEMVPQDATAFRLEDGWDPVIDWLQALAGPATALPRVMPERNVLDQILARRNRITPPVEMTPKALALIAEFYGEDFARFGYPVEQPASNRTDGLSDGSILDALTR